MRSLFYIMRSGIRRATISSGDATTQAPWRGFTGGDGVLPLFFDDLRFFVGFVVQISEGRDASSMFGLRAFLHGIGASADGRSVQSRVSTTSFSLRRMYKSSSKDVTSWRIAPLGLWRPTCSEYVMTGAIVYTHELRRRTNQGCLEHNASQETYQLLLYVVLSLLFRLSGQRCQQLSYIGSLCTVTYRVIVVQLFSRHKVGSDRVGFAAQ